MPGETDPQLRRTLVERGLSSDFWMRSFARDVVHFVNRAKAEVVIWSYLECAECGQKLVGTLTQIVPFVKTRKEFVKVGDLLLARHRTVAHALDKPQLERDRAVAEIVTCLKEVYGIQLE